MNKKTVSESDICDKFIRPAIEAAGWDGMSQFYREYPLRAGRVVVRGRKARRDAITVLRADYALFFKTKMPKLHQEALTRFFVPRSSARRAIAGRRPCYRTPPP